MLETLRRRLEEGGVPFRQVPRHTLVRRLAQEKTSWLAGIVATFLNHAKSGGLSSDNLRSRARHTGDRRRNEGFLDVFDQVRVRYRKLLDDEKAVDFHDLINLAAEHMLEGRWKSRYRYVLVDEFQDISAGRVALIQALGGQDTAYFLVGDDWQSIYRFAGSDVGLLRGCSHILGHVEERTLSQTFRFANGILDPSTEFVKRNPEQTQRSLFSASAAEDGGVTVVADSSSARGAVRALHDIEANAGGQRRSVLVLGRYRQRRGGLSIPARKRSLRVEFNTVHAAKGGEADYVLVLDLKDGRWGFPSQVEGDPLLELVLPPVLDEAYPFAEERRLFYVAMTLVAEEIDSMAGELAGRLEVVEAELGDVRRRLERLYEALETSDLTLEALSPRILSLRHREEQLEAARYDAASQLEQRRVDLPTTKEIKEYVSDFREFLKEGTIPERKALIRNFVEGIEVVGDEATLTYTIPMPNDGVSQESASVLDFVQSSSTTSRLTPKKTRTYIFVQHQRYRVPFRTNCPHRYCY